MILFYAKQAFLLLGYCIVFSLGSIFISVAVLGTEATLMSTIIGEAVGFGIWMFIMITQADMIGPSKALIYAMLAAAVSGLIIAFTKFQVNETSGLLTDIGLIVFACCMILIIIVAFYDKDTFVSFISSILLWIGANIIIAIIPMFTPSLVYDFLTMQH